VIAGDSGKIQVIDLNSDLACVTEQTWFGHDDQIRCAALSEDKQLLLTASHDGTAKLWDLNRRSSIGSTLISLHDYDVDTVSDLVFTREGLVVAGAAKADGVLAYVDLASRSITRVIRTPGLTFSRIRLGPGGRLYALANGRQIVWWDSSADELEIAIELEQLRDFWPRADRTSLLVAHVDSVTHAGKVAIWDLRGPEMREELFSTNDKLQRICASPDDRHIAVGMSDGPALLFASAAQSNERLTTLALPRHHSEALAFRPAGGLLAIAGGLDPVQLVPLNSNLVQQAISGPNWFGARAVAFSPDSMVLALACPDRLRSDHATMAHLARHTVGIWDIKTRRRLLALDPFQAMPGALAWSPDGRHLAVARVESRRPFDSAGAAIWHFGEGWTTNKSARVYDTSRLGAD
jgi:WD40 repeat protein